MSETTTAQQNDQSTWRDKTLKAAGIGYSTGDVAMGIAGLMRGKKSIDVVKGSLIWLAGGVAAAQYGHPDPHKQLEIFSQKFEKHLHDQGITIPDDLRAQNALLKKPTFLQKCENFLYQHPSEMLNLAYAVGSVFLLHSGVKEIQAGKDIVPKFKNGLNTKGIVDSFNGISKSFWIGSLVGSGALAGLLIKEDPDARKKAEHGGKLEKAVAYIKEKPLRLTGALYTANNIFTVLQAMEDHSNRAAFQGVLKPHHFSTATAATYILSNALLSSVSRDRESQGFSADSVSKLENAAAQVIAAQRPEKQKELLTDVAAYIAAQKGVTQTAPEITQALADRIASLTQERLQPAVEQAKWAAREAARLHEETPEISR